MRQVGDHARVLRQHDQRALFTLGHDHADAARHALVGQRPEHARQQLVGIVRLGNARHHVAGHAVGGQSQGVLAGRGGGERQHEPGSFGLHHGCRRIGIGTASRRDEIARRAPGFDQIEFQVDQLQQRGAAPRGRVQRMQRAAGLKTNPAHAAGQGSEHQQPNLLVLPAEIRLRAAGQAGNLLQQRPSGLGMDRGPSGRAGSGQLRPVAQPGGILADVQRRAQGGPMRRQQVDRSAVGEQVRIGIAQQRSAPRIDRADQSRPVLGGVHLPGRKFLAQVPGQHRIERAVELAGRSGGEPRFDLARRGRRANQPHADGRRFGQQFGGWWAAQPHSVQPESFEPVERLAAVFDQPREQRLIAHDQARAADADGNIGRRFAVGCGGGGQSLRPSITRPRPIGQRRVGWSAADDSADFQIVDHDVGRAGPAIDIQEHAIDKRLARLNL